MKHESAAGFAVKLRAEFEAFREFHHMLQQEQAALVAGDIEQLLQLAPGKTRLVEKLTTFSNERGRDLATAGYENNLAGLTSWFNTIGVDKETRELWKQLLNLAREAEQANRANGILIATHLRHNQQALATLQTAANPVNNLYGPNGQISGTASGRVLGKI